MTSSWDLDGTAPTPAPAKPRHRRRIPAWAIGLLALIVVGAGLGVWWASSRGPDARDVAEQYLAALEEGDVSALRRVTGASIEDPAIQAFAQASSYVADATLEGVQTSGDRATARASVTLGGETHTFESPMERSDGVWRMGDVITVTAEPSIGDTVAIGELSFAAGEPIRLYPAQYELTSLPGEVLDGSATVTALPGADPAAVEVPQTFVDEAQEVVQERLAAHAEECAAATDAIPEACGIVVPWPADLREFRGVAFTIDHLPWVEIDTEAMTFAATGGSLTAAVTGIAHDGSEETFTYRADDWTLRGTMEVADGRLVLSVF
ncbi:hypothetical protein [Microbacterium sediminis]|uniref:Uncharacterized protein n=1 Tax=Microbacterium sediminis TaxID=904291 RepID=A0A1B9NIS6_9MICO|nr:hypothetical protein [Microbacterium sediminis]OCG76519.1 hypothetical protein A7J15_11060 [Microbacterium sediminis]QBR73877.1 hypothetical protein E3O41_05190 [Microbacterium sediminis]